MVSALLLVLLATPAGPPAPERPEASAARPGKPRTVVVLHQFEPAIPITVDVGRGIASSLDGPDVVLLNEYLDQSRRSTPETARLLARTYASRYAGQHVDLVIAIGRESLQFLLDSRAALWPHVPIVFGAAISNLGERPALPPDVTGVEVKFPIRETLELALQLLPESRHVALIYGSSPEDERLRRIFHDAAAPFGGRLEVLELGGLTYAELEQRVAALPPHTFLFGLTMLRDASGRQLPGPAVVELVSSAANAPMLTVIDTTLGHGTLGGWVLSYEAIGRDAGALARRVLDGEPPARIPVRETTATRLALDARQLEQWGIPRERLPAGSEVLFTPPPPFFAQPAVVAVFAIALVLEGALILALLLERRRRLRSEQETRRDRARIAHLNRVTVVGELTATLAHEVNAPLAAMLNDARATRRFLDGATPRLADARACIAAIEEQGQRARDVILQLRRALRKEAPTSPAAADVSEAVADALRLVRADALEHAVALERDVPDPAPVVACDAVQLQQVLLNLLLNAIEAVRDQPAMRRRVRVEVRAVADYAALSVRDWGKGVSPEQRARLFEAFYTTRPDGLGMGLSISRSIVEAHGGRISMQPPEDGGAAFHFTLPLTGA
jgi:signal transduction histidine kinase